MDHNKLVKSLSSKSYLLIPHIESYLARAEFPEKWVLTIHNTKEKRDYGEALVRFSPTTDSTLTVEDLVNKHINPKVEEPISASTRMTFDCGSMWHEYIEQIVVHMGLIEQENVERYMLKKIGEGENIAYTSGIGDLVGVDIPGYGKWLVDIKTMNANSFKSPPQYLMEKYINQINLYGEWFGYKKLMILCICKDSPHSFKEIIIPYNSNLVDSIYAKWIEAYRRIREIRVNV